MAEVHLNGTGESRIAESLQDDMSHGYKPQIPLEALWSSGGGDAPQITLRRDLEFMQMHPVVSSAIEYYKSGISGAEFWGGPTPGADYDTDKGRPISPDSRVSQFVLAHAERFWQRGMPLFQEGYIYGWAPGEHIYKESSGMLVWSHLKSFHPSDGYVLTYNHQTVGIRVKNIRDDVFNPKPKLGAGGSIDLWFAAGHVPAKAGWYPHRPRFSQLYGRSQLIGGWRPWRRLGWRDGIEQVIDAAVYRAGYKGPVVRHPQEDMQTAQTGIPATRTDGAGHPRRPARDVARQIVEWAKAGAGFTLSSAQYPPAQGGGNKWDIEWPDHVMDVRPLIEAAKYLEDQIMLGIGVPPELVKAGGTGSGYSGRSIPREAFLDGQQHIADAMLQIFVEQVIRPLVIWNFGDIPFNIQVKPLLKSQTQNKQGEPKPPLPQPAPEGEQPPGGTAPPSAGKPPSGAAMSLDGKVMGIVKRVMDRRRAFDRLEVVAG